MIQMPSSLEIIRNVMFGVICLAAGCAEIEARKVPLSERLCESDDKIDGFRYYVSRPYVVVNKKINIRTDLQVAQLMRVFPNCDQGDTAKQARTDAIPQYVIRPVVRKNNTADLPYHVAFVDEYYLLDGTHFELPDGYGVLPVTTKESAEEEQPAPMGGDGTPATPAVAEHSSMRNGADGQDLVAPAGFSGNDIPFGEIPVLERDRQINNLLGVTPPLMDDEPEPDDIEVAFLPDFEEQMAIKHKNCLARSKFELHFSNGWQLDSMNANLDSTQVAVEVLQTVQSAISAAAAIRQAALKAAPTPPDPPAMSMEQIDETNIFLLVSRTHYIPPGMYRFQKTSEMNGYQCTGGFLSENLLGIPIRDEIQVQLFTPNN